MAQSPSALNGRVLDPSAVASWTEGRLAVQSWLGVAGKLGLTMRRFQSGMATQCSAISFSKA